MWIELGMQLVALAMARMRQGWLALAHRARVGLPAQSTVEYALVGALVVIAAAGALTLLGGELNTIFTNISTTLKTASVGH
ncbi:MAG: hypothetical protein LC797_23440 [Chloroflexi bacterium]|nr:hypothetical protein [Chloroflexota bacterium]